MKSEISYTRYGDYYLPDIQLEHTEDRPLGKYGWMRRACQPGKERNDQNEGIDA